MRAGSVIVQGQRQNDSGDWDLGWVSIIVAVVLVCGSVNLGMLSILQRPPTARLRIGHRLFAVAASVKDYDVVVACGGV